VNGMKHDRDEPTLEDAIGLAVEAHRGQVYPSPDPEPYVLHSIRVMLGVTSRVAQIVAVLHDVVEDTNVTLKALEESGFGRPILDAVDCLSHRPGEAYEDYIDRLAANPLARQVKLADLRDNLANNRALPPTQENLARIAQYERAQRALAQPDSSPLSAASKVKPQHAV
jgi:(p)ppGpp synthase/HD superfamily hydrolase